MPLAKDAIYLDVVEKINALALEEDSWSALLDEMAELFGAEGVSFEVVETASKQPLLMECGSNLGEAPKQSYLEYYGPLSPRVIFNEGKPSGFISYDHMFLSESDIDNDEFYADCIIPQGLRYFLAGQIHCSASHQAVISVQRTVNQGHVGTDEIELLERLLPHMQRAMDLKFRMAAARGRGEVGLEGLELIDEGCLIVDPTGAIRHMNAVAGRMISGGDGISAINGQVSFHDAAASQSYAHALGRLIAQDSEQVSAHDFPAHRPSGNRPYLISLRALPLQNAFTRIVWPAAAIVFIRDPNLFARLNTELLQQSFLLTAAEMDVATALDRGLTLRQFAEERQVSITTIRTHLYTLMAKLDVRRQTDLVRLLAQYRQPFS